MLFHAYRCVYSTVWTYKTPTQGQNQEHKMIAQKKVGWLEMKENLNHTSQFWYKSNTKASKIVDR